MSKAETSKGIFLTGVWRTQHSAEPPDSQPGCGHLHFANFLLTGWCGQAAVRVTLQCKLWFSFHSDRPKSGKAPVQIALEQDCTGDKSDHWMAEKNKELIFLIVFLNKSWHWFVGVCKQRLYILKNSLTPQASTQAMLGNKAHRDSPTLEESGHWGTNAAPAPKAFLDRALLYDL